MEAQLVTFAVFTAVASLVLALVVLFKVVRLQPGFLRRMASTAGFRWLLLGLVAMTTFLLLNISALIPALVAIAGVVAMVVELRRNGD